MGLTKAKTEYLTSVVLYGTIGVFLRYISFPSEMVVLCRGAVGAAFILLVQLARRRRPDAAAIRENLVWLLLSGVCLGFNWVLLFAAYRHTTVAVASLCNYMAPIALIFLSPLLFREKLSGKKLLCVLAGVLGLALVSGVFSATDGVDPTGALLGLAAAAGFVGVVLCNKKLQGLAAFDKVTVQLAVSALTVLPYVLWANAGKPIPVDTRSVLLTAMLGVVHTGLAYCLYFGPMDVLPVQTIALLGYVEPVVSVLCSALILREPLGLSGALGAALIIGAAAVSEIINQGGKEPHVS